MRLKEDQIRFLASKVYGDLVAAGLLVPHRPQEVIIQAIVEVIQRNLAQEQTVEQDAEKLLEQTLAAMGRGAADIDRRKMLKMIKDKLAKERKVVL